MFCLHCKKEKMFYIKRGLCKACYQILYRQEKLCLYPNDHNRWAKIKYSPELLDGFKRLVNSNDMVLQDIGSEFGFSREYARQLFEKIYGFHYTVIKNKQVSQKQAQKETTRQNKKDPRYKVKHYKTSLLLKGAEGEKRVFEICAMLNYEIKPFTKNKNIDLVINNYNVEIKTAYKTTQTACHQKTPLFHFSISAAQKRESDFVVCWAAPMNAFFIIPIAACPENGGLYIPEKPVMQWNNSQRIQKNKYYEYLEAWHLLKPKEDVIFSRSTQPEPIAIQG